MKKLNVAILGVTGAVGQEMLKVLQERNFPVNELRPLASAKSAGKKIVFKGEEIEIKEAKEDAFDGIDIVLGAAENDVAEKMAPFIKKAGAIFVDNSSAFRLCDDVPLVVPEINGADAYNHNGIIANPNCSTIITLMAVAPIAKLSPIKALVASTYQAVSGAGAAGLKELEKQIEDYAAGNELENRAFAHQIAFNLIPKIGGVGENGFTSEEMKLQNEGRKILHLPDMKVCCTCVRVPVMRSHSISATVVTEDHITVEKAREAIAASEGVIVRDEPNSEIYPMPLESSDQDKVLVGRIRYDLINDNGLALWCCGDQIRKGAATNAIQIAELFTK